MKKNYIHPQTEIMPLTVSILFTVQESQGADPENSRAPKREAPF